MNLHISPVNGLIFAVGCFVGYAVYRHSKTSQPGPETKGDPVAAIATALVVVSLLAFLFGVGGDSALPKGGSEPSAPPSSSAIAPG
ncbi:hypothetical protein AB0M86_29515 [Streptomyces sp. NPDC051639]|uniref:hypothetical protein n=1 Tax=Streptomyces sp. NPDC051639 TaxID=3155671 RepID=UPI00344978D7